ncbi:hypothetical protein [Propionicicella superfundia]|uniref:hypothetical protein n=1 Tax=Propionicicella superfundia TaxID=348582 RepID=UPI0004007B81|nr:hypothetical protein [Propionicicella superfundia]
MIEDVNHPELVSRVAATTGLTPREAARVVDDVLAYLGETVEEYVRRRHSALQNRGMHNTEIFPALQREIRAGRFRAPELSERQLRRLVYG